MPKENAIKKIRARGKKVDLKVDIQDRDYHGNGSSKSTLVLRAPSKFFHSGFTVTGTSVLLIR